MFAAVGRATSATSSALAGEEIACAFGADSAAASMGVERPVLLLPGRGKRQLRRRGRRARARLASSGHQSGGKSALAVDLPFSGAVIVVSSPGVKAHVLARKIPLFCEPGGTGMGWWAAAGRAARPMAYLGRNGPGGPDHEGSFAVDHFGPGHLTPKMAIHVRRRAAFDLSFGRLRRHKANEAAARFLMGVGARATTTASPPGELAVDPG